MCIINPSVLKALFPSILQGGNGGGGRGCMRSQSSSLKIGCLSGLQSGGRGAILSMVSSKRGMIWRWKEVMVFLVSRLPNTLIRCAYSDCGITSFPIKCLSLRLAWSYHLPTSGVFHACSHALCNGPCGEQKAKCPCILWLWLV